MWAGGGGGGGGGGVGGWVLTLESRVAQTFLEDKDSRT